MTAHQSSCAQLKTLALPEAGWSLLSLLDPTASLVTLKMWNTQSLDRQL